jgi:hypothetical protein
MRSDIRIIIEPADNGYIVKKQATDYEDLMVFGKRRQVMHFVGKCMNEMDERRSYDLSDADEANE